MRDTELIEKFCELTPEQRQIFEPDILSMLTSDAETAGELTNLKHKAYEIYAVDIAHLIAELEVHSHDLPKWMYGFLEMIFRLTAAAAGQNEEEAKAVYARILRYERSLINIINLTLIDYYANEIKRYKRTLARFNHHGVYTDENMAIIPAIQCCLKRMSKLKKIGYRTFRERYRFDKKNCSLEFKLDSTEETAISELESCVNEGRKGIELCEKFYPFVVNNGFVSTCPARIIHHFPAVLSFILAVVGAMVLILK